MPQEDTVLLEMLQYGNAKSAYEQIFKKYYKLLCAKACYMLGNMAEAEDLVQELLGNIWEKQLYRNINISLSAYLYRAVKNRCLDFIEKKKNQHKQMNEYRVELEPELIQAALLPTIGEELPGQGVRANFDLAISELPTQQLEAFNLVYMERKRYQEAAEKMGISINSVKTHLRIAIRTLRQKLLHLR